MTPHQKMLVQTSFAQVAPIAETAAALFYNRLFELDPSLRPMFTGDIAEQGRKLMQMLTVAVRGLDDWGSWCRRSGRSGGATLATASWTSTTRRWRAP